MFTIFNDINFTVYYNVNYALWGITKYYMPEKSIKFIE